MREQEETEETENSGEKVENHEWTRINTNKSLHRWIWEPPSRVTMVTADQLAEGSGLPFFISVYFFH